MSAPGNRDGVSRGPRGRVGARLAPGGPARTDVPTLSDTARPTHAGAHLSGMLERRTPAHTPGMRSLQRSTPVLAGHLHAVRTVPPLPPHPVGT